MGHAGGRESAAPELWASRQSAAAAAVLRRAPGEGSCSGRPDVACLQEHWFDQRCVRLWDDRIGAEYGDKRRMNQSFESETVVLCPLPCDVRRLQRTGWNCEGESADGVVVAVRRRRGLSRHLQVARRRDISFADYGLPQTRRRPERTETSCDTGTLESATATTQDRVALALLLELGGGEGGDA
eukprot:gene42937-7683_t